MMERIIQKIGRINDHLRLIRDIEGDCRDKFTSDPIYRGALLHYLYLMADSCISLAELVIKNQNLRIPQSYAEAFDILGDAKILDADFAYRFASIAGFRNFLAHDYEKIDPMMICEVILPSLGDVDLFLKKIHDKLPELDS